MMTIISFSQSWEFSEEGNPFDGKYKIASIIGQGSSHLNKSPILFIKKFDDDEIEFSISPGFFANSNTIVLFNFDEKENIYESLENYYSDDGRIIFKNLDISFYEMFKEMKNGNKLWIRLKDDYEQNDMSFSLSGSSKAINFVINKELFEKLKQESELETYGCTDPKANNYDPQANFEDDSCQYLGCTDLTACNYNESANTDDGSCEYAEEYYDCDGNCINDADGDGYCDELKNPEFVDFQFAESSPIFPGCIQSVKPNTIDRKNEDQDCLNESIMKHIFKNFEYPKAAKEKYAQGKVFVSFVIDKTGTVNDVRIHDSFEWVCHEKSLCDEAIRLVKSIPKMIPAKLRGKPVGVSYMVPINFKLN